MAGSFALTPSCETNRALALVIQKICERPHWTFDEIRDAIGEGLLQERKDRHCEVVKRDMEIARLNQQVALLQADYAGLLRDCNDLVGPAED